MKKINLIDCTFRDGGYYTNWKFNQKLVREYVESINLSNIKNIEVGFRFLTKNSDFGKFAFSSKKLLKTLNFKKDINKIIMVNGSDFLKIDNDINVLNKNFSKDEVKEIKLIRIAIHYNELEKISKSILFLKEMGFDIGINLMQITQFNSLKISNFIKKMKGIFNPKVFYFADSLGNLDNKKVINICKVIKQNWKGEFGIHAHDNCGLALSNTLLAIENGANWVDSTISGIGRGAGNVSTENLISKLNEEKKSNFNNNPIYLLSANYFSKLKKKYKWGTSIFYFISAQKKIHPSYTQQLVSDNRYNNHELLSILNNIGKRRDHSKFISSNLDDAINSSTNKRMDLKDFFKNDNIIIIGQGMKAKKNITKIKNYKQKLKAKLITINFNKQFNSICDYILVTDFKRFVLDSSFYNKKIIMPLNQFGKSFSKKYKYKIFNYEAFFNNSTLEFKKDFCIIPKNFSLGYALSICLISNTKGIFLAGFDGYSIQELNNENKIKFERIINKYNIKINYLTKSYLDT